MSDANKVITSAGLNRILKAVGKEYFPASLDREALASGLNQCIEWYGEAQKFHTDKYEMAQRRELEMVLARVERLRRLMKDDDIWRDDRWHYLAHQGSPPQTPRAAVESLERLIGEEIFQRSVVDAYEDMDILYRHTFQAFSPFEWLIGDWLPAVYAGLQFECATISDGLASATGPYVRFARATADELNIKKLGRRYAVASFVKAIKTVSSWDVRRRLPRELYELQVHAQDRRDILLSIVGTARQGRPAQTTAGQMQSKK
ncbi:hypothetical protein BN961_03213 [Afipia felis]|uniref:Uncharacterized protein n=1 Tax=Afipia felis TaxID=1035 RepID=A0A090MQZ4_AFIFE|nr:hypothetical protein [Afipia felis]CEG09781.1 hypothetical protein BN961_03213 [Afipia felis]